MTVHLLAIGAIQFLHVALRSIISHGGAWISSASALEWGFKHPESNALTRRLAI